MHSSLSCCIYHELLILLVSVAGLTVRGDVAESAAELRDRVEHDVTAGLLVLLFHLGDGGLALNELGYLEHHEYTY
jgi:hypothetical protein